MKQIKKEIIALFLGLSDIDIDIEDRQITAVSIKKSEALALDFFIWFKPAELA